MDKLSKYARPIHTRRNWEAFSVGSLWAVVHWCNQCFFLFISVFYMDRPMQCKVRTFL